MGRKRGRMSPVGCPTAGHKILVVLINAWSKKKKKKKTVLFMTPVEKSKRFQAHYHVDCLWWRERAK